MTETECRVCLQQNVLKSYFLTEKLHKIFIWEALNNFAGVKIVIGDPYPQQICENCHKKLSDVLEFQFQVIKSDKLLHKNDIECIIVKQESNENPNFEPKTVIKSENDQKIEVKVDFHEEFSLERPPKKRKFRSKVNFKVEKSCFRCCMCQNLTFHEENLLFSHIQTSHVTEIESNSSKTYTRRHKRECPYCKKRFRLNKWLKIHFFDINFIEPPRDRSCEYENGKYKYKSKRGKGEKVICSECGLVLANKNQMKMHELRLHAKEHPFDCLHPGCGKKFAAKRILKFHQATHADRKHICDVCGKGFLNERFLETHSYVHKNVKKYQCAHCPRTFTYKIILKGHVESHFAEKIFRCDQCEKTYKWKNDLTAHVKGAHQGNYPYKCKFCDKGYFCSSSRKYHQDRCDKSQLISNLVNF